jgi:hypothetical protein
MILVDYILIWKILSSGIQDFVILWKFMWLHNLKFQNIILVTTTSTRKPNNAKSYERYILHNEKTKIILLLLYRFEGQLK